MEKRKIEALWSHVHWLGVLASAGSFTAAALRLGVSKAAMSQRIAELERAAGVSLVQRTTRSVRLTEAGQQLADTTQAAFAEIERSFVGVRDRAELPSGLLRVTAPVALGRQQIVPLLPAFLKQHPLIRVELELSDRLASLAREGFDLAIRHVELAPDTHVAWSLCETHSVLAATRAYLKRCGTPAVPADLATHNCLHYVRPEASAAWSFVATGGGEGRVNVPIGGSFAANNSEALREAALAGTGIALLPDFTARRDMAAGRLVAVLPGWRPVGAFGSRIFAIRPPGQQVPRAVHALVAHLREALAGGFSGEAADR